MLKLENQYDEINKTYFKEMKYVDRFSWNKYNGDDDELTIPFFVGVLVFVFMGIFVHTIAFVFSSIFLVLLVLQLFNSKNEDYIDLNTSYLVQLEDDDKPKYYSKWYLEITGVIEYEKKVATKETCYRDLIKVYSKELKEQLPKNSVITKEYVTNDMYDDYLVNIEYLVPANRFKQVEREPDRKHWKNNIPENRILTWSEYKKYKKGKMKEQELLKQAEYIKEFKEYYGLEAKEIEEIIK